MAESKNSDSPEVPSRVDETSTAEGCANESWFEGAVRRAQRAWEATARESVEEIDTPDWQDAASFFVSLALETDRAIPVLAYAFIDSEIERSLRAVLNPEVAGGVSALFGPLGPLGPASARVNMVHALYWIDDGLAHDLGILRKIRNRFAHERMPSGLDDRSTLDRLSQHRGLLRILAALLNRFELDIDWSKPLPETLETTPTLHLTTRNKLIFASAVTAWNAMAQLYVAPLSQRRGIHASALLDHTAPEAPVGIREQREAFEGFIDGLLWVLLTPDRVDALPSAEERASVANVLRPADSV